MDAAFEGKEMVQVEHKAKTAQELEKEFAALRDALLKLRGDDADAQEQLLIQNFIDKQLGEKDAYKHVFKTDQGSIYFGLETGEVLRVKRSGDLWQIQPMTGKLFFTEADQSRQLEDLQKSSFFQEKIIGIPIQTSSCKEGNTPFEFGILGLPPILFDEKDNVLTIKGDKTGVFASGFHQGHPITEVIK